MGAHRHIRPKTILIDNHHIRIGDFCLDKSLSKLTGGRHDTDITYRPPELLLGTTDKYVKDETPGDISALGCIFSELLTREHLFEGKNDTERVESICRRIGPPTEKKLATRI